MEPEIGAPTPGLHSLSADMQADVLVHLSSIRDFGRASRVCRAWHADGSPVQQALRQRIKALGNVFRRLLGLLGIGENVWIKGPGNRCLLHYIGITDLARQRVHGRFSLAGQLYNFQQLVAAHLFTVPDCQSAIPQCLTH